MEWFNDRYYDPNHENRFALKPGSLAVTSDGQQQHESSSENPESPCPADAPTDHLGVVVYAEKKPGYVIQ